jgi:hypothetical protein
MGLYRWAGSAPCPSFRSEAWVRTGLQKKGCEQDKRGYAEHKPAGGHGDGEREKHAKVHGKHTAGLDADGERKDRWMGPRRGCRESSGAESSRRARIKIASGMRHKAWHAPTLVADTPCASGMQRTLNRAADDACAEIPGFI